MLKHKKRTKKKPGPKSGFLIDNRYFLLIVVRQLTLMTKQRIYVVSMLVDRLAQYS